MEMPAGSGCAGERPTHSVQKEGKKVCACVLLSRVVTACSVQSGYGSGLEE